MNTALWIIQGILAAFFLMPAYMKLSASREKLIEGKQIKPEGSALPIRILGLMELMGSVGIIVPYALGILPILTPVAAVGFGIVMLGAIPVHISKKDYKMLPLLVAILVLSGVVAYYRFAGLV